MESKTKIKENLIERDGMKCSITNKYVDHPNELQIHHITPLDKGGSNELDNLILVDRNINKLLANTESYRANQLLKNLEKRQNELNEREKELFERETSYRVEIERQKDLLEEHRKRLITERKEQDTRLIHELEAQRESFHMKQAELDIQLSELEEKNKKNEELSEKLKLAYIQLEKDKELYREESRQNIQAKSNEYVNDALTALQTRQLQYSQTSNNWSRLGILSILLGIFVITLTGSEGYQYLKVHEDISWSVLTFITFKGVIIIGLFVALAKFSLTFSNSYMHESLKSSERIHAINFGKFYLESYGADANWEQIKDAFEHWNISTSTAFSPNSDSEAQNIKTITALTEIYAKLKS